MRRGLETSNILILPTTTARYGGLDTYSRNMLLQMRTADDVPLMTLRAYINDKRQSVVLEIAVECTFVDVMLQRPEHHPWAVVELRDDVFWLLDLLDSHVTKDLMVIQPGRRLEVRTLDAAIAAAAFGW